MNLHAFEKLVIQFSYSDHMHQLNTFPILCTKTGEVTRVTPHGSECRCESWRENSVLNLQGHNKHVMIMCANPTHARTHIYILKLLQKLRT